MISQIISRSSNKPSFSNSIQKISLGRPEKPVTDKLATEKPSTEKPAIEKIATEKFGTVMTEKPASPFAQESPKLINDNHKFKKSCKCLLL